MAAQAGAIANRVWETDRPVHAWYRFVLSFPPHLVRDYLADFGLRERGRHAQVLDPFCGTGTTLVECKKLGIDSVGVEANPMAHFASATKVDWSADPSSLRAHTVGRAVDDPVAGVHLAVATPQEPGGVGGSASSADSAVPGLGGARPGSGPGQRHR